MATYQIPLPIRNALKAMHELFGTEHGIKIKDANGDDLVLVSMSKDTCVFEKKITEETKVTIKTDDLLKEPEVANALVAAQDSDVTSVASVPLRGPLSETSEQTEVKGQLGGRYSMYSESTLGGISEVQVRKFNNYSDLNVNIFKKIGQSGGSNNIVKNKLAALGINSSSTSSVCE